MDIQTAGIITAAITAITTIIIALRSQKRAASKDEVGVLRHRVEDLLKEIHTLRNQLAQCFALRDSLERERTDLLLRLVGLTKDHPHT